MTATKVNVTKFFGGGGALGQCDPKVGLVTDKGTILSLDSGNYTVVVGVGSGSVKQRFYPEFLYITYATATGSVAWPTGVGCVRFGHSQGIYANGAPVISATGMVYMDGGGIPKSFSL